MKILAELQTKMRGLPQYLCPSVTEAWLRRYQVVYSNSTTPHNTYDRQVLPGRTHPTMVMSGSGGFILHAIKVYVSRELQRFLRINQYIRYDDPSASGVATHRRSRPKKANTEVEEATVTSEQLTGLANSSGNDNMEVNPSDTIMLGVDEGVQ